MAACVHQGRSGPPHHVYRLAEDAAWDDSNHRAVCAEMDGAA